MTEDYENQARIEAPIFSKLAEFATVCVALATLLDNLRPRTKRQSKRARSRLCRKDDFGLEEPSSEATT